LERENGGGREEELQVVCYMTLLGGSNCAVNQKCRKMGGPLISKERGKREKCEPASGEEENAFGER